MFNDPQFIETPIIGPASPPVKVDSTVVAQDHTAPLADSTPQLLETTGPMPTAEHSNSSDQWLEEERSQYWTNVLKANPVEHEYLMFKKLDSVLAKEAGAHLDDKGVITEVSPAFLVSLEEKMYVLIELARRNLEESKRFSDSETLSSSEIVERLQDMVNSELDNDHAKRVSSLLRDKSATIGALHDMLVESETNAAYECLEKAHEAAGFLNDIRSGHASKSLLKDDSKSATGELAQPAPQMVVSPVPA